ncbi:MAG: hypothetical protein LBS54_06085 [Dysgonamonadaceae bacterium]|jgi:hypothetical protein|nr:hypothetical protein [Dysgonamonadaceae bacterium]
MKKDAKENAGEKKRPEIKAKKEEAKLSPIDINTPLEDVTKALGKEEKPKRKRRNTRSIWDFPVKKKTPSIEEQRRFLEWWGVPEKYWGYVKEDGTIVPTDWDGINKELQPPPRDEKNK